MLSQKDLKRTGKVIIKLVPCYCLCY